MAHDPSAAPSRPRSNPPRCTTCSHPSSFHSNTVGSPCRALACHCTALVLPEVAEG